MIITDLAIECSEVVYFDRNKLKSDIKRVLLLQTEINHALIMVDIVFCGKTLILHLKFKLFKKFEKVVINWDKLMNFSLIC